MGAAAFGTGPAMRRTIAGVAALLLIPFTFLAIWLGWIWFAGLAAIGAVFCAGAARPRR